MGMLIGVGEAILALAVFLGLVLAVRAGLQKKAPEGNSSDITNGETLL